MNGFVDEFGRALVALRIRAGEAAVETEIHAWIDTAFNGELVLPRKLIEAAQLVHTAGIDARLADGSIVTLESFTCMLSWFEQQVAVEAIANDGEFPLLGIGLLTGRLVVDYQHSTVAID